MERGEQWFNHNPDIYTIVVDVATGKVVGYINAMPLYDEVYRDIEEGRLIDVDLPTHVICRYDFPGFYKLYIASIAVDPAYQITTAVKTLLEGYIEKLLNLARQEVYVSELLADAVSPQGERLAQFIGMKRLRPSEH